MTLYVDNRVRDEVCQSVDLVHADAGVIECSKSAPLDAIQDEFYGALKALDADREILATLQAVRNNLDDEDLADLLQEWNEWELMHRDAGGSKT